MSGQTDKFERCPLYLQSKHRGHANRCPLCANSGHSGLLPKQIGRLAAAYRKFDQRQRADRYNNIGPPKSDSSVRTIPLDREAMVPALKEWKLKCPPSDFVFPISTGRIEHHANMLRGLEPIMVKSGVIEKGEPKYALHAFRHFFASWCINPKARGGRELPPKQVQYLLGHSTISMTFDIYGHLFPSEGNRDELTAAVRQLLA